MSDSADKNKVSFADSARSYYDETKSVLDPKTAVVHVYTLIAVLYCSLSALLFYYTAGNNFLAIAHLLTMAVAVVNYLVLLRTKNLERANNIILSAGVFLVGSLFATGGWENTGYIWTFVYLQFAFLISSRVVFRHVIAAVLSVCSLTAMLHFTGAIIIPYSTATIVIFFAALLIYTVLTFVFQKASVRRDEFIASAEAMIEAAPEAVIVIDERGEVVKWNRMAEVMLGWKAGEVTGRLLSLVIIPPRYRDAYKQRLADFLSTGKEHFLEWNIEMQVLAKNNMELDVAVSISPVIIKKQHLFIGFFRNITEGKRAEEKLREFRHFFYNSNDLACIANINGYFEILNPTFERVLGYSEKELLEKQFFAFIHNDDIESTLRELEKLKTGAPTVNFVNRYCKKDGNYSWFEWNATSDTASGKLYGIARDITARKEAERKN